MCHHGPSPSKLDCSPHVYQSTFRCYNVVICLLVSLLLDHLSYTMLLTLLLFQNGFSGSLNVDSRISIPIHL